MKFYRLDRKLPKVGNYPQVQNAVHPVPVDDPRHIGNIWGEAKGKVAVPQALLAKRAKVLDWLSAASIGFDLTLLVSERFAELIRVSNYYGIQFFSTEVITPKREELPYEIIHPYEYPYEMIDVKQTKFLFEAYTDAPKVELTFNQPSELRKKYSELKPPEIVIIEDIVFNISADLDFFPLRSVAQGGIGWFMSDLLKKECEKIPITGITYEPV